jgi:hypothetical protein
VASARDGLTGCLQASLLPSIVLAGQRGDYAETHPADTEISMNPDIDARSVMSLLQGLGLSVDTIPESSEHRTPDLRVSGPAGDILIEVKSKEDDKHLRQLLAAPRGTVHLGWPGSLSSRIREGWHQIRDYPDRTDADFGVLWFITRKQHGMTVLTTSFVLPLLYGIELLEGHHMSGQSYEKPCFFLHGAMFQRYRHLDAVVVHDDRNLTLCLNSLSPSYLRFRSTSFARAIGTTFAVIDPPEAEAAGQCFLADCPSERDTVDGAVRRLKAKYDLDTVTFERFVLFNEPS